MYDGERRWSASRLLIASTKNKAPSDLPCPDAGFRTSGITMSSPLRWSDVEPVSACHNQVDLDESAQRPLLVPLTLFLPDSLLQAGVACTYHEKPAKPGKLQCSAVLLAGWRFPRCIMAVSLRQMEGRLTTQDLSQLGCAACGSRSVANVWCQAITTASATIRFPGTGTRTRTTSTPPRSPRTCPPTRSDSCTHGLACER